MGPPTCRRGTPAPPTTMSAAQQMSQVTLNAARAVLVVITALAGGVISVRAQQSDPSSVSLERIRAALQSSQQPITITSDGVPLLVPIKPDEFRLGVLTLVPPDT